MMTFSTALINLASLLLVATGAAAQKPANPIKVNTTRTQFLGPLNNSPQNVGLRRDVGSEAYIGGVYYQIFADVLQCPDATTLDGCYPLAPNSISEQSFDPTLVFTFGTKQNSSQPGTFCVSSNNTLRAHLSNAVAIDNNHSASYFTELTEQNCALKNGCPYHYGVSVITVTGGQPNCTLSSNLWDVNSEPGWGTTGAIGPAVDGRYYLFGALGYGAPGYEKSNVYTARCFPNQILFPDQYEYWNGTAWSNTRLKFNTESDASKGAILTNVSVGSTYYSNYYKQWVALAAPGGGSVVAYAASSPEGPWSDPVVLWTNSTYGTGKSLDGDTVLYLPQALTAFDASGQSLIVDLGQFVYNDIRAVLKLFFYK